MNIKSYFFDTYAFFEIINGNQNYKNYIKNVAVVTTKLNLMELYYGLLRNKDKKEAEKYYNILKEYSVELSDDIIKSAAEFRFENKKLKLSYADCIGYITALSKNINFLTGDKGFKNLPNVEYMK